MNYASYITAQNWHRPSLKDFCFLFVVSKSEKNGEDCPGKHIEKIYTIYLILKNKRQRMKALQASAKNDNMSFLELELVLHHTSCL